MSNTFSRTMRTLSADNQHWSVIIASCLIVFLSVWLAWFFMARITLYEVSGRAQLSDITTPQFGKTAEEAQPFRVTAQFPEDALGRVQPGQAARLRLDAYTWPQYGSLPLMVDEVKVEAGASFVSVSLVPSGEEMLTMPLQGGMTGTVEVEIDKLSPAALALRAAGKLVQ